MSIARARRVAVQRLQPRGTVEFQKALDPDGRTAGASELQRQRHAVEGDAQLDDGRRRLQGQGEAWNRRP